MKIKAISIKEPWASRIRNGEKTIEQRTWRTNHRGKLLLVASKTPASTISGKAFAIADLVDCRPMEQRDEQLALVQHDPDTYSWVLDNITLIKPFSVKGKLMLYDVDLPIEYRFLSQSSAVLRGT